MSEWIRISQCDVPGMLDGAVEAEKRCFARYRDRFVSVEAYGADPEACMAKLRAEYDAARDRSRAQMRLFAAVESMRVAS